LAPFAFLFLFRACNFGGGQCSLRGKNAAEK
jgi:hypothetical protein